MKINGVAEVKTSCQLLGRASLFALHQRNMEAAHKNLLALIQLTARQSPEPLVISQLVRIACAGYAINGTWYALQVPGWTEGQLASLQSAWESCDFERDMAGAFEMERAMELEHFALLKQSRKLLAVALGQLEQANELMGVEFARTETHGFMLHWLHGPFWRFAWADQDALVGLLQWQQMVERVRIAKSSGWATLLKTADTPASRHSWMRLVDELSIHNE